MQKRSIVQIFLCILLLLIFGCAGKGRVRPEVLPEKDPQACLKRTIGNAPDFKYLSGDAKLKIRSPEKNLTAKSIVFLEKNSRFHLQILNVFHQPQLLFLADTEVLQLYIPSENRLYYGEASPENIARLLGIRLDLIDFWHIFAGNPPLPPRENTGFTAGQQDAFAVFTFHNPPLKTEIRVDRRTDRIVRYTTFIHNRMQMKIDYSAFKPYDKHVFPSVIELSVPEKKFTLSLTYNRLEFTPISENIFKLTLPLNVSVHPFSNLGFE